MRLIETRAEEVLSAQIDVLDSEIASIASALVALQFGQTGYMTQAFSYLMDLHAWVAWRRRLLVQEACL